MQKTRLFDGIFPAELKKMRTCLHVREKEFADGSVLMSYSSGDTRLGVIQSGEAELIRYDREGRRNLLGFFKQGDPFGRIFIFSGENSEAELIAVGDCRVLFFDYEHLLHQCSEACVCHARLIGNILQILAESARELTRRFEVLSQRTLRDKLLTFLYQLWEENGRQPFELPMTYADLADYLFADRSAMQRELKKLRDEGVLSTRKRRVILRHALRPDEEDA